MLEKNVRDARKKLHKKDKVRCRKYSIDRMTIIQGKKEESDIESMREKREREKDGETRKG